MLRRKYKTAVAIAGLSVMAVSMPVAAAGTLVQNGAPTLVKEFEKDGVRGQVWAMGGCEISEFPGIILPGEPDINLPGTPDSEKPVIPDDGNQGAPEKPEVPEKPGTPEKPEKPETPDQGTDTENQSFAMRVIELVNQERAKEGLPALVYDAGIEKAALVRAKETEKSFSHTRPDGKSFSTALTEAGVTFRGAGENIAYGQRTPEQVMEGWMNSPGHRANIMNKDYKKIGVGYYQNANGVNYWTQLFTY